MHSSPDKSGVQSSSWTFWQQQPEVIKPKARFGQMVLWDFHLFVDNNNNLWLNFKVFLSTFLKVKKVEMKHKIC